jgi:hypothetical protein
MTVIPALEVLNALCLEMVIVFDDHPLSALMFSY